MKRVSNALLIAAWGLLTVQLSGCGGSGAMDKLGSADEQERSAARNEILTSSSDMIPELIDGMNNSRKKMTVRVEIAKLLSYMAQSLGDENAWNALLSAIADPKTPPEIKKAVSEEIISGLFADNKSMRKRMEKVISEIKDEKSQTALFEALLGNLFSDDEEVRMEAIKKIGEIKNAKVQKIISNALVGYLDQKDQKKAAMVVDAIIQLDQPAGIEALQAKLTNPDIKARSAIANTLAEKAKAVANGANDLSANDIQGKKDLYAKAVSYNPFDSQVAAMQVEFLGEIGDAAGAAAAMNAKGSFLTSWDVVGPFDDIESSGINPGAVNLSASFPNAGAATEWTPIVTDASDGSVDLRTSDAFSRARGFVAAVSTFKLKNSVDNGLIKVNTGYEAKVFLDGKEIFSGTEEDMALGEQWIKAALPAGDNTVLLWINARRPPSFAVRISDADHKPVEIETVDSP